VGLTKDHLSATIEVLLILGVARAATKAIFGMLDMLWRGNCTTFFLFWCRARAATKASVNFYLRDIPAQASYQV
jgi:hypothetical protein